MGISDGSSAVCSSELGLAPVLVDTRPDAPALEAPFRVIRGARIEGTRGGLRVNAIDIVADGRRERLSCDAVLMCGGFTPAIHLASQSRGRSAEHTSELQSLMRISYAVFFL